MAYYLIPSMLLSSLVLLASVGVLAIDIPLFYVDPVVLKLASRRFQCIRGGSAAAELAILKQESASEFFRSHELYAHTFFVESGNNPHKVQSLAEAEFEYIPLLPLNWRVESAKMCNYPSLIEDILKIQAYVEDRDKKLPPTSLRPKFSVASTYNMRTAMGWGMPTQFRKGEVYQNITNFVLSLSVGHYERYPQCPDLLRKSWKYVVEVPYVPMHTTFSTPNSDSSAMVMSDQNKERKYWFHFSGTFVLYGCEMVCSVRNAAINLNTRADTLIVNTTVADANTGVRRVLQQGVEQSTFCLVTKGDSYSTSFFYHAISAGCIPVVISDWFTFSYPWIVPYELFTLRVAEVDFLKNPHQVLDHIKTTIGRNPKLLTKMRESMNKFKHLLSFEGVAHQSDQYRELMSNDLYGGAVSRSKQPSATPFVTTLPMELLLLELRYAQTEYKYYNGLPCYRPHMCHHDRANGSLAVGHIFYSRKGNKDGVYSFSPINRFHGNSKAVMLTTSTSVLTSPETSDMSYNLVDGGMQVNYLHFPTLEDTRSHMCRHSGRLIGHYKIVFFMQCVRILWPLQPGQFKPVDNANRFDPSKRTGKESNQGIVEEDYKYVRNFHNLNRSSDWVLNNYPVTGDLKRVYNLKQAEALITL